MENFISPKYLMVLIDRIEKKIWEEFSSYKNVERYILKWYSSNGYYENFAIVKKSDGNINLTATLDNIEGDTLLKIAIDLGIDTPGFIPSIPIFRNEIKSSYETASATFEKAFRQIEEHPDIAIGLANSALESIIKEILKDDRLLTKPDSKKTLYDLTKDIIKEFAIYPDSSIPSEIKTIGSSLLSISQSIERLRSDKTNFHGKTLDEYIINESLYAYLIINSIVTVGLFLDSFYKNKFPKEELERDEDNFNDDDLPF